MLESFLQYIEHEKRYSIHTIQAYTADLHSLSSYLSSQYECSMDASTQPMLRSWVMHLAELGNNPKTINRKLASVKSFYKFLLRREIIDNDPSKNLISPKVEKKLPQFVQQTELVKLLDSKNFDDSFGSLRDKLVLELLYGTGIRLSELIYLTETKVDLDKKILKVLGKGKKERLIPINASLSTCISLYLDVKKEQLDFENKYLLVTDKGDATYPMYIYRIVKKYLSKIYSSQKKSPHVLRHTFATHLLNKGADLSAIKDLLGHSSLAATQVYTHNSLDKLKNIFNQAHPKA